MSPIPTLMRHFGLLVLVAGSLMAEQLPAGLTMEVRMRADSGTRISRQGDPIEGVLIAPVMYEGRQIFPAGLTVQGKVAEVQKLGFGFHHETALIQYQFDRLQLPSGKSLPMNTRLMLVDTAREHVDVSGNVHGIRPTTNISSTLSAYAWRLVWVAPAVALPVWAIKFAMARSPDPEIYFPQGSELLLRLTSPMDFEPEMQPGARFNQISVKNASRVRRALDEVPGQRAVDKSQNPSDPVNVALVGSRQQLVDAFTAAGWLGAKRRSARSAYRTYRSLVERIGYAQAPFNSMTIDGAPPDLVFQKSLNSVAKRHHGRLWRRDGPEPGKSIWLMAATEDVSIKFRWRCLRFTHRIDPNVDNERTKVVNDLLFTGCIDAAGLLPKQPGAGSSAEGLRSDGRVAVLELNGCKDPRLSKDPPAVVAGPVPQMKKLLKAFGDDVVRSNVLFVGYHTTRLVTASKTLFVAKHSKSPRDTDLKDQQSQLLAASSAPAKSPAAAREASALLKDPRLEAMLVF
jgi:hypothetical protein